MFDFGIANYRPCWLTGPSAVARRHGPRLGALIGRVLRHTWVVWDLGADEWFRDCPVLLDFDGEQVEINHHKFDELSITWNTVDPLSAVVWPVPGFDLAWRADVSAGLSALTGRRLADVALLEWTGRDMSEDVVSLGFGFPHERLTVHNALDENGFKFGPFDSRQRRHRLR